LGTGSTAASADPTLPVTGITIDQGDGTVRQAVRISRLYPGSQQQAVFLLDGDDPARARRMEVAVTKLADYENECIHPETATGDDSCGDGAGEGELSGFLDVSLQAGTEGRAYGQRTCRPVGARTTTSLAALRDDPVVVGLPTDDDTLCVIATFGHVDTARDNVTQTDEVQFDLRLRFDTVPVPGTVTTPEGSPTPGPTGTSPTVGSGGNGTGGGSSGDDDGTDVAGVKYERPIVVSRVERGRVDIGALPRTGLPVQTLLFGSVLLVGAGSVMVAVVRGRRRRAEEVA
jgi:hypothetical protein